MPIRIRIRKKSARIRNTASNYKTSQLGRSLSIYSIQTKIIIHFWHSRIDAVDYVFKNLSKCQVFKISYFRVHALFFSGHWPNRMIRLDFSSNKEKGKISEMMTSRTWFVTEMLFLEKDLNIYISNWIIRSQ